MTDVPETEDEASVQIIHDAHGVPLFAAVPHDEFEELVAQARRAAGLTAAAEAIREETNRLALIPMEVVHRIANGEHPVRVWRLHRGMNAVDLAHAAGISPGLLSEIETGKKDGDFQTMVRIARTLEIKLDDLIPTLDEELIEEHRREVQLRDIARRISEIDSMINGNSGFDSGAVRDTAKRLISDAESFMRDRAGNFSWLETVTDKARTIINEINTAEKSIVDTVTQTQGRLSEVFADSLVRAGLFPREMMAKAAPRDADRKPDTAPAKAETPEGEGEDVEDTEPGKPAAEADDGKPARKPAAEEDDEGDAERPRGWFPR